MSVTIDDVAKHAGVSHGSVTNVMNNLPSVNEEICRRVLKSIKELNYVPNEAARRIRLKKTPGKTYNIGCILALKQYNKFSNPYHGRILESVDREAVKQGYHLFFTYTASQLNSNLRLFGKVVNQENVDGIIVLGNPREPEERELLEQVSLRIKSIVCAGRGVENTDNVARDGIQCGYDAVKYLTGLGHKRIAYIGNYKTTRAKRFNGYRMALHDFGLRYDESIVEGGFNENTVEDGYKYMIKILERANPLPTAVFAYSYASSLEILKAINDKGLKVSDDISLIRHSEIDIDPASPPITTLQTNREEIGKTVFRRLLERIQDPYLKPVEILIPCVLIDNKSCKRIA